MGRRDKITLSCNSATKAKLEQIALDFNCKWGDSPNISALLESIAIGEIALSRPSNKALAKTRIARLKKEIQALKQDNKHANTIH